MTTSTNVPASAVKNFANITEAKVSRLFKSADCAAENLKKMTKPFSYDGKRVKLVGYTGGKTPTFYIEGTAKRNPISKALSLAEFMAACKLSTYKMATTKPKATKPTKGVKRLLAKADAESKANAPKKGVKPKTKPAKKSAVEKIEAQILELKAELVKAEMNLVKALGAERKREEKRVANMMAKKGYVFVVQAVDPNSCKPKMIGKTVASFKAATKVSLGTSKMEIFYRPAKGRAIKVAKYVTSTTHKGFEWKFTSKKNETKYAGL
jgi:hypothetical protein